MFPESTTSFSGVLHELSASEAASLDDRGIPRELGTQERRVRLSATGYDKENHTVTFAISSE